MDRFSLLLLEPSEIYFEDFKVVYHTRPEDKTPAVHNEIPGRLKVCSKSVVFVPQNLSLPMLKFPLADCDQIDEWSPKSFQSSLASKREIIFISCRQTVEMLRQNKIAPFKFIRCQERFVFSFTYRKVSDCLSQVQQLHRAASLPPVEQAGMLAAINFSRQNRLNFDTCWLENIGEKIVFETIGNKVTPLVLNPGRILLTSERLYFQSYNNIEKDPVTKIKLGNITDVYCRRFLLRPQGLEIDYLDDRGGKKHIYLSLVKKGDRDKMYSAMLESGVSSKSAEKSEMLTLQWQHGVVSNYEYLLHLNSLADRSFNDLTQYPVFPWVVSDYTSSKLELDKGQVYRDLTKPVGALNAERLNNLKARREEMASAGETGGLGGYLYGSHYSCPGFVLYYLVRKDPQLMLCLQNGRFDHPDRMFNSLQQTWRNVTTNSSDFKELVPEFYDPDSGGDFLCNRLDIEFGSRHTGQVVGDVELPPWAESPRDLVDKLRLVLESPRVSSQLPHWIDLIFGYKNSGPEAEAADNVFYPLCYEGGVDLDTIADLEQRFALEVQISEFGQVPKKIFSRPHPQRYTNIPAEIHANVRREEGGREEKVGVEWGEVRGLSRVGDHQSHRESLSAVCLVAGADSLAVSASEDSSLKLYSWVRGGVERSVSLRSNRISSIISPGPATLILASWDNSILLYNILTGALQHLAAHTDAVSCLAHSSDSQTLLSGSWDGTVKVWRCQSTNNFALSLTDLICQLDHGAAVTCLDVVGDSLATGTSEGEILVWLGHSLAHRLPSHRQQVNTVKLSPCGEKILSGGSDLSLKVFDLKTGTVIFNKKVTEEVTSLAWDGVTGVMAGAGGSLTVWELTHSSGQPLVRLAGHEGRVTGLHLARDKEGRILIVTGGQDKRVIVWRLETVSTICDKL